MSQNPIILVKLDDTQLERQLKKIRDVGKAVKINVDDVKAKSIILKQAGEDIRRRVEASQGNAVSGLSAQNNMQSKMDGFLQRMRDVMKKEQRSPVAGLQANTGISQKLQGLQGRLQGVKEKVTSTLKSPKGMLGLALGMGALTAILTKASGILQSTFTLMSKTVLLILRPIGDFIGLLLRPMVIQFLRSIIPIMIPMLQWAHTEAPKMAEAIMNFTDNVIEGLTALFQPLLNLFGLGGDEEQQAQIDAINAEIGKIGEFWEQQVVAKLTEWWHNTEQWFTDTFQWGTLESVWNDITAWANDFIIAPLEGAWEQINAWANDFIIQPLQDAWNSVTSWADDFLIAPLASAWETINLWADNFTIESLVGVWGLITDWADNFTIESLVETWRKITVWADNFVIQPFMDLLDKIKGWSEGFTWESVRIAFGKIQAWANTFVIEPLKNAWNDINNWANAFSIDPVLVAWDTITDAFIRIGDSAVDVYNWFVEHFGSLLGLEKISKEEYDPDKSDEPKKLGDDIQFGDKIQLDGKLPDLEAYKEYTEELEDDVEDSFKPALEKLKEFSDDASEKSQEMSQNLEVASTALAEAAVDVERVKSSVKSVKDQKESDEYRTNKAIYDKIHTGKDRPKKRDGSVHEDEIGQSNIDSAMNLLWQREINIKNQLSKKVGGWHKEARDKHNAKLPTYRKQLAEIAEQRRKIAEYADRFGLQVADGWEGVGGGEPNKHSRESNLNTIIARSYASGGIISEPVVGVGKRSGDTYSFAEGGAERVTPVGAGRDTPNTTINATVNVHVGSVSSDVDMDKMAEKIKDEVTEALDEKLHNYQRNLGVI